MLSSNVARFGRVQHRRLAGFAAVRGPAHRGGGIDRHDLAGDQPVEQVAQRGEPLLHGRRGVASRLLLDPGRDMQRLDGGDAGHGRLGAPRQEIRHGAAIGAARVRVADGGGEEFQEAHRGVFAGGGDQGRQATVCQDRNGPARDRGRGREERYGDTGRSGHRRETGMGRKLEGHDAPHGLMIRKTNHTQPRRHVDLPRPPRK